MVGKLPPYCPPGINPLKMYGMTNVNFFVPTNLYYHLYSQKSFPLQEALVVKQLVFT